MTALAHIELSDQYPVTIRAFNENANLTDRYRTQSMVKTISSGRWQRLSGFARAQVLHDYVGVLDRKWDDQSARTWEPSRDALRALKKALDSLASADVELVAALRQEIENTKVHDGFEAFRREEGDERERTLEDYDLWFSRNSPYLVLGLPLADVDAAEAELWTRIDFFLNRMPDVIGLEETYTERAWDYARRAYPELRQARTVSP